MYELDSDYDSGYNSTDTEPESESEPEPEPETYCGYIFIYTTTLLKSMDIYIIESDECDEGRHRCTLQSIEDELNKCRDPLLPQYCVEAVYDTPLSPHYIKFDIFRKLNSYTVEVDEDNEGYQPYAVRCVIDTIKDVLRTEGCVIRTEDPFPSY